MSIARARPSCWVALLLLLAPATRAQRVPVAVPPQGGPAAAIPAPRLQPEPVLLTATFQDPVLDDAPDFAPTTDTAAGPVLRGNPYTLAFVGGAVAPEPGIDPALLARYRDDSEGVSYGFVMLRGRMSDDKLRQLELLGLELCGVHTWQCVKARIPLVRLFAVRALPFVHWIGYATREQKLDPDLLVELKVRATPDAIAIHVSCFTADAGSGPAPEPPRAADGGRAVTLPVRTELPDGPLQRALAAAGLAVESYDPTLFTFHGRATAEAIHRIAALDFVLFVEPARQAHTCHDQTVAMVGQDRIRNIWPGNGVTLGVIDGGVNTTPWHQDLGGKALIGWDTTGDGVYDDQNGHGTHVTGTICGAGFADPRYRGVAPAIGTGGEGFRLFVGRFTNNAGVGTGSVSTHYTNMGTDQIVNGVTNRRPRAVNCSWGVPPGSSAYRGTDSWARGADQAVYDHAQCYVFAAGNYSLGTHYTHTPGVAKNALTVGAVGDRWIPTLGAMPGTRASFSAYEVADGRIKPDVMAPGDTVTSLRKNTATGYGNLSGTSMATPHVTGMLGSLASRSASFAYNPPLVKAVTMACAELDGEPGRSQTHGFGLVDSYKMNVADRAQYRAFSGTLTTTGTWQYQDLDIPAGIAAVHMVLTWIEPAASSGAAQARVNDLRCVLDIEPFDTAGNVGEYNVSSSVDNVLSLRSRADDLRGGFAFAARGRRVRCKVYGQSVPTDARYGLCLLWYQQDPRVRPLLTSTVTRSILPPGGQFEVTGTLTAPVGAADFHSALIWFDYTPDFIVRRLLRTTADGVVQQYLDNLNYPSYPFPNNGYATHQGPGIVVGAGALREMRMLLEVPAREGPLVLNLKADVAGMPTLTAPQSICVDGTPPANLSGLTSTTHAPGVWSNVPAATFTWNTPTDVGCAGVAGLATSVTLAATAPTLQTLVGPVTTHTVTLQESSAGRWFNVRAVDRAGNLSVGTASLGPLLVDTTPPVVTAVVIDGGATYATSLMVQVAATATDALSGPFEMRYSSDGTTWSGWSAYQSTARTYDLSSNGGTPAPGTKLVFVQVRDRAGNVSAALGDSIEYLPCPLLTQAVVSTLDNVTADAFRFTGSGLGGVADVSFGATVIASRSPDDWDRGWLEIVSDTELRVHPPQGLTAGSYLVQGRNAACTGNALPVTITYPSTRVLRGAAMLTAGQPLVLMGHRGDLSPSTVSMLALSGSNVPSVFPGLVTFGLGNGFADFTYLAVQIPHDPTTGVAVWGPFNTYPRLAGATLWWQSVLVDLTNPLVLPVRTSDLWSTRFR